MGGDSIPLSSQEMPHKVSVTQGFLSNYVQLLNLSTIINYNNYGQLLAIANIIMVKKVPHGHYRGHFGMAMSHVSHITVM